MTDDEERVIRFIVYASLRASEDRAIKALATMLADLGKKVTGPQTVETDAEYAARLERVGLEALQGEA